MRREESPLQRQVMLLRSATNTLLPLCALLLCFSWQSSVAACQIPVYRYALERWAPDRYQALIVHQAPLSTKQRALVDKLQQAALPQIQNLNVIVDSIDLSKPRRARHQGVLERYGMPPKLPGIVLLYPHFSNLEHAAWKGPLDSTSVARLIDSPVRQEIARRLTDGEHSAVWVLLSSTSPTKDEVARTTLRARLAHLEKTVELPTAKDIRSDTEYLPGTQVDLKLKFSLLTIDRNDPAEEVFASVLANSEDHLPGLVDEPTIIPVFGRGRSYFSLTGPDIVAYGIDKVGGFVAGPCSCQVKRDNPGVDLLFAVKWDTRVFADDKGSAIADKPPPPLTGLGQLSQTRFAPSDRKQLGLSRPIAGAPSSASVVTGRGGLSLAATLSGALGLGMLGIAGVALIYARRRRDT